MLTYLTGERTAFLLLFLHLVIIIFLLKGLRLLRIFTFIISLLIIFLLSIYFPESKNRMINDTYEQLNIDKVFNKNESVEDEGGPSFWSEIKNNEDRILAFSPHHELTYRLAINIFKDNFWFGIGPKMYREVCKYDKYYIQYGCTSHPHSTYIQILTETGFFGFLFILSIFAYTCWIYTKQFLSNFFKIKKIDDTFILFLAPLFINLWPIVPSGSFFNNWLSIIYFLPIGFILYFNKK